MELSNRFEVEPMIWIQNFQIPVDKEAEVLEAIAVSYAEGVRNFATWSFFGSEYMSYIKCENPKRMWDLIGEIYGKLQQGDWD